jgi:hypothetical protein
LGQLEIAVGGKRGGGAKPVLRAGSRYIYTHQTGYTQHTNTTSNTPPKQRDTDALVHNVQYIQTYVHTVHPNMYMFMLYIQ